MRQPLIVSANGSFIVIHPPELPLVFFKNKVMHCVFKFV